MASWRSGVAAGLLLVLCGTGPAGAAPPPPMVPGLDGAVRIPFEMPLDGEATLALYNRAGRVVRILAQLVPLTKGPHVARWDGMDLFGNLLPAGEELELKVFSNRPLRATYEFTVGHAGSPPWLTRPQGEGAAMRTGGWMGDHTPPQSALAFGDRVFFGCKVAEHGHALIATDLAGRKLWGRGGLEGWKGPALLAHDGRTIWGVAQDTRVHRIDPQTYKTRRLIDTGKDKARALAAREGRVYLVVENHLARREPFVVSLSRRDVDCPHSRPQVIGGGSMPEGQLNGETRMATVFAGSSGHPQTGLRAVYGQGFAYFIVKFRRPVEVGTVVLEAIDRVAEARVHVLREGAKYDLNRLLPTGGVDEILAEATSDWVTIGRTKLARRLNFVTAPKAGLKTEALYVHLSPKRPGGTEKWTPRVGLCRIMRSRFARIDPGAGAALPKGLIALPEAARRRPADAPAANGWRIKAPKPVSEVNPVPVVIDLKAPRTVDGICLLNCTGPVFLLDAYVGPPGAKPAAGNDAHWKELMSCSARRHKRGWDSAKVHHNERYYALQEPVTTRALRLRFTSGRKQGKWGVPPDVRRLECADLAVLKLSDAGEKIPPRVLGVYDGQTGKRLRTIAHASAAVEAMAFDADGQLYCVVGTKLCRSEVGGKEIRHTVLNDSELKGPVSLAVSAERIAVGDAERSAVLLFEKKTGRLERVIGGRGPRKRGPWDAGVIVSPTGVAIAADGRIWVAESRYSPKRIARFSPDGKCEKELLGPAEYGGGGFLDPDLKSFYYRSMHFELDFAAGTWRLKGLNDRLYTEATPCLDASTFAYTKVGRPIYLDGRRYVVGDPGRQGSPGVVVCLLAGGVWRPCAVIANAEGSPFLVRKESWKRHWLERDLSGKCFIWCDRNGDGGYQVEEVELFEMDAARFGKRGPLDVPYWCSWIGPGLEFWGRRARLKPARFTDQGVPIYRARDLEPFDYSKLSPLVTHTMVCGMRAKPGPESTSIVTRDGSLLIEGQPWKVQPDMTIRGGEPPARRKGQYVPPIAGCVLDNPLHWVGTARTASPIGEVGVMLGNSGKWFAWSADHGVIVGRFFTGEAGGWGTDLPANRGTDVTGRRLGSECFFGHFVKAHDGRYFAVAGHGFHAISRIDGLDDIRVQTRAVTVTPADLASNRKLQPLLAAADAARRKLRKSKQRREIKVAPLDRRTRRFRLDGAVSDWLDAAKMEPIGEPARLLAFAAAYDANGLYLAYTGVGYVANSGQDWKALFKTGFAFDLRYRSRPSRARDVVAGDRRIVFAQCDGRWTAVRYDYVDESVPHEKREQFASPWVTTTVARVVRLAEPAEAVVRFRLVKELDLLVGLPKGQRKWSAEVFLPWKTLGVGRPDPKSRDRSSLAFDVGVLLGNSGGTGVERRCCWANRAALTVSDLGMEARIRPGAWGRMSFQSK